MGGGGWAIGLSARVIGDGMGRIGQIQIVLVIECLTPTPNENDFGHNPLDS